MRVDILDLPADHTPQACDLFLSVFGHSITPAQWRWKYEQGPRLGSLNLVARDTQGRLVGHAGATVFAGSFQGRILPMAQVCDIMVLPEARGGLGSAATYPRLVEALRLQLQARYPGVLAYGFPGTRPFKLGERMGYYRRLYDIRESTLDAGMTVWSGWLKYWNVVPADWDAASLDSAWSQLGALQPGPIVMRSADYLAWRYRDHPQHRYRLWACRRWWRDACWLVTRALPDGTECVVDALLSHPAEAPAAVAALSRAMATQTGGGPTIRTWMPLRRQVATPIVAMEFRVQDWHADWPAPAFQPGDTDVY